MKISSSNLHGLQIGYNALFNKAFAETPVFYSKVAMEVNSESSQEVYTWLGAMPSMREWIGDRIVKALAQYDYTIKNKDFELTVSIPVNAVMDDTYGVYSPVFQDLGYSAKRNPDKLIFSLFPKGFSEKCFDGKPFFSDSHKDKLGGKNALIQSNKGTYKLTPDSYGAARAQMMALTNYEGDSLCIIPDLLVVAPQKEAMARRILLSEEINDETNPYKGTAEPLVVPELSANPEQWFLLCTKRPIRPFIFQNRQKPEFAAKNRSEDDNVFFQNEYIYGVKSRCNAGYGLWQLAFGSTGAEDYPTT
ncbi:Mu-like prophage major head subunit gpT family protein [Faecalicatena sp. BF-R-105]|nr:Mu-like prophage major head subunit gpT family protein [Faecalicatena sp. BF-R-105]